MSPTRRLQHYEWDEDKDFINQGKHSGIAFADAITIFDDPSIFSMYDPDHSEDEDRYIAIGRNKAGQVLVVSFTARDNDNNIRVISARKAVKKEEKLYYSMGE